MKDKILVAKWGYSMILATWVKVIKESPKSLVVDEVKGRNVTDDELKLHNLSQPGFLQCYTVPTNESTGYGGYHDQPFRVYKRESKSGDTVVWVGHPKGMSTKLYFREWDGKPEFEDHCD